MAIKVLKPGLSTTVQDLGRPGYYNIGIPLSGGMDRHALAAANLLVGNAEGAAVLEAVFITLLVPPLGRGEVLAEALYDYRGTVVNGRHAVFEDGSWVRVEDSTQATLLDVPPATVYPIVTANHLLVCEQYICADVAEMDEDIGSAGRLAALNADTARNRELTQAEDRYGFSFRLAA